ncbi:MAG: hypothetical protein N4J56_002323 [Chroococcidiopsis sp. SAG 2025]|uniref:GumC family protein n=1 Tax=Chroococcidiopsis sp. SAG 2025 TaxID=171389 RepID=UPI0029372DF3|nr:hypothetical protein [Chroococcidiopsis sp. SAG 2025]MDV2992669.1 hypothetical protein [Chroococcidiopsis sp. SAG 2025]
MTESVTISRPFPKSRLQQVHWSPYLLIGILANAAIWCSALAYLKLKAPTYMSGWAVNVPGTAAQARVSLPEIGQTSLDSSSPYSISTQDPRQNYKFLAESDAVIQIAATQMDMTPQEFGKPKVRIGDSTSIIEFQMTGDNPEEARDKSYALYRAIQARVNELRVQEFIQRDASFQSALSSSQRKLEMAQKRLSDYKAISGLNSSDQLKALSDNIEALRKQRAEIVAQQQQSSSRLQQLAANLNLSEQDAANAFVLQTDQIFQQNLKNYSETSANLVTLSARFLPDHPTIVAEQNKRDAAAKAMLVRSESLLGRPVSQDLIQQLNLNTSNGSARENLFQALVDAQAENRGLQSQAKETEQQILQLENRLRTLSQKETTLEALRRELQVSEAVFSSTLANLDIIRSNAFGSYPLLQIVAEPNLPKSPSSPKRMFILLGATGGSLFVSAGILAFWLRQRRMTMLELERKTHHRIMEG